MMPERLPLVDLTDMHFHHRRIIRIERVQNGDRRVGKRARIDDNPYRAFAGLVYPVDNLALVVRLQHPDLKTGITCRRAQALHIIQRLVAVDIRLALTEQVQVRTVQDVNSFHVSANSRRDFNSIQDPVIHRVQGDFLAVFGE